MSRRIGSLVAIAVHGAGPFFGLQSAMQLAFGMLQGRRQIGPSYQAWIRQTLRQEPVLVYDSSTKCSLPTPPHLLDGLKWRLARLDLVPKSGLEGNKWEIRSYTSGCNNGW